MESLGWKRPLINVIESNHEFPTDTIPAAGKQLQALQANPGKAGASTPGSHLTCAIDVFGITAAPL